MNKQHFISEVWRIEKNFIPHRSNITSNAPARGENILSNKISPPKQGQLPSKSKHISIYASLLPDVIINCDDLLLRNINPSVAVLMYLDISGFTPLSEKCAESGDDGVFKLTAIVNDAFSKIISPIYQLGGDVWKFAGDAFLAVWRVGISDNLGVIAHKALFCALHIQKNLGCYLTESGIMLKVKIGLSSGNLVWTLIGDNSSSRGILVGSPVQEVKEAENLCGSGEVILSASVWNQISPNDCVHHVLPGGRFVKVVRLLGFLGLKSPKLMQLVGAPDSSSVSSSLTSVRNFEKFYRKGEVNSTLRSCILPLVVQQIDADLDLNYINQLRTLTLLFINIVPKLRLDCELIAIVGRAYQVINSLVQTAGGLLEKVSMFDKDIVFVTIFGLRGVHENQLIVDCLNVGYDITEACVAIRGIQTVSVGITTGLAYCGVVGHPLRSEFTVMGPAVNKAARIMCEFPNTVSCDTSTFAAAQLPSYYFKEHHQRRLRGFSSEEKYYQYIAHKMYILHNMLRNGIPPLLGREKELKLFLSYLKGKKDMVVIGEERYGKSRFVDEVVKQVYGEHLIPIVISLRKGHSLLPYGAAIHILFQAYQVSEDYSVTELKKKIENLLRSDLAADDLDQLHNLFQYEKYRDEDQVTVPSVFKRIFTTALYKGTKADIIVIDDIHLCDLASWELVVSLFESRHIQMVMTWDSKASQLVVPPAALPIKLGTLDPICIAPLACQLLRTQSIDTEVASFLETRSKCIPGLCQTYLESLLKNNYISIKKIGKDSLKSGDIIILPSSLLRRISNDKIPIPIPPFRRKASVAEVAGMDLIEFHYQNLRSTLNVMAEQQWWTKVQKSLSSSTSRWSQSGDVSEKMPPTIDAAQVQKARKASEVKHWPGLVRSMFHTDSSLCLASSENITSLNLPFDKALIEESVSIFKSSAYMRPFIDTSHNDIVLDTLKVDLNMKRVSEMRQNFEIINNDMWKSEEAESSIRLVVSPRPSIETSDIVNENGDLKCIAKVSGINLDEIASDCHVNFLFLFDNLRPFEQLVLKCAAIIGFQFTRPTLEAILRNLDPTMLSLAIMRLMDLNILGCTKRVEAEPRMRNEKKCGCYQPQSLVPNRSLPYYAFCNNLEFQYASLKTVIYDILPPNQKRMFHARAVESLSAERMICLSCSTQLHKVLEGIHSRSLSSAANTSGRNRISELSQILLNVQWLNLVACSCSFVEMQLLKDIIYQCEAAYLFGEAIKFKIKYARLSIKNEDCFTALETANFLLTEVKKKVGLERREYIAECEVLLSEVSLENGNWDKACYHILKAIRNLVPFSRQLSMWSFIHIYLGPLSKIWLHFDHHGYYQIAGKALMHLASALMMKKSFKEALAVNSVSLKLLQKSNDLINLCKGYANQIDVIISQEGSLSDLKYDQDMIDVAHKMLPAKSIPEVLSIAQLIHAIYIMRVMGHGDLKICSDLLIVMNRINMNIPATISREMVMVETVHVLMLVGRFNEAITALLPLRTGSHVHQLWFHALCLNVFRITGYWVEDPTDSIRFIENALKTNNPQAKHSLVHARCVLALRLWHLWTDPQNMSSPMIFGAHPEPVRNVSDCVARMEELMAMVLQANVPAAVLWWSKINRTLRTWITEVGVMANRYKIMLPMYLHFRSYIFYRMEYSSARAQQALMEAAKVSEQQGSVLLAARIAIAFERVSLPGSTYTSPAFPPVNAKEWTEWRKDDWIDTLRRLP